MSGWGRSDWPAPPAASSAPPARVADVDRPSVAPGSVLRARVLVADHDAGIRRSVARELIACGFDVLTAGDFESALGLLRSGPVDVMLADVALPGQDAGAILHVVLRDHPRLVTIMMPAFGEMAQAVRLVRAGAYDLLVKPFASPDAVILAVTRALEHRRLIDLSHQLKQRLEHYEAFEEWLGSSPPVRQAHRIALAVASSTIAALIVGEAGTGKKLLARIIHEHSARAGRALVYLHAGALPPDAVERELFGVPETGQTPARRGLIDAADRGTLVLGDPQALSAPVQLALAAMIQTGKLTRGDAEPPRTVDVRVLALSEVDAAQHVASGALRAELSYALTAVSLHIPALRKRTEDIAVLAHHFMHHHAQRLGRGVRRISAAAIRVLREQPWPGNVCELKATVEHAVVLAHSDTILAEDLGLGRSNAARANCALPADEPDALVLPAELVDMPFAPAKDRAVRAFEQAYLKRVLQRAGGNISEAARLSGLDRSNFRRVLKKGGRRARG